MVRVQRHIYDSMSLLKGERKEKNGGKVLRIVTL